MKKLLILAAALALLLCGCGKYQVDGVEQCSYRQNRESGAYELKFALLDPEGQEVAAPAKVTVSVEDDLGNVLYEDKMKITQEDFDWFQLKDQKNHYLANIEIPADALAPGRSVSGQVKFRVKKAFAFSFKNLSCEAVNCLPIQDVSFICEGMNQEFAIRNDFWNSESIYRVDDLSWQLDRYTGTTATLSIKGQKVQGSKGTFADMIRYQVKDSEDQVIQSGELYLNHYSDGKGFDAMLFFSNLTPGEEYTLRFYNEEKE